MEKQLDFRAEREGRDKKERDDKKRAFKNLVSSEKHEQKLCGKLLTSLDQEEAKKQEEKEREEAAKLRSYSNLMTEDNMK